MTDLKVLALAVLALYAVVLVCYARMFLKEDSRLGSVLRWVLPAVIVVHVVLLSLAAIRLRYPPFMTSFGSMSFLAFFTGLLYLYIEWRTRTRATGALIFIFVFLLQGGAAIAIRNLPVEPPMSGGPLLSVHVMLALLGYTAFSFSFLYSVMYLMLHEDIRSNHFGILYTKLPPLEQLDAMNYQAAAAGTTILSAAMCVGFVWAWITFRHLPFEDLKVLVTLSAIVVYGAIVLMKRRFGWEGERIALLSVGGFFIVLLSMLGVNVFAQSFHSFF